MEIWKLLSAHVKLFSVSWISGTNLRILYTVIVKPKAAFRKESRLYVIVKYTVRPSKM